MQLLVRDFQTDGLKDKEAAGRAPGAGGGGPPPRRARRDHDRRVVPEHEDGARPASEVVDYALRGGAARRARGAGRTPIRGGTDGSRLSFMGLPTPNLFAGEHNFHSRLEWVSRAGHGEGRRSHRRTVPHLGGAGAGVRLGASEGSRGLRAHGLRRKSAVLGYSGFAEHPMSDHERSARPAPSPDGPPSR